MKRRGAVTWEVLAGLSLSGLAIGALAAVVQVVPEQALDATGGLPGIAILAWAAVQIVKTLRPPPGLDARVVGLMESQTRIVQQMLDATVRIEGAVNTTRHLIAEHRENSKEMVSGLHRAIQTQGETTAIRLDAIKQAADRLARETT